MPEHIEESEWISRSKEGDDDAFTRLVEAYQVPVFNLCYRMLGDRIEAEDAAQETFLRAFQNLNRYDPNRRFATWLLSIASHHSIDRLRRRRFQVLSLEELLPRQEKPDSAPGPEASLVMHQTSEAVRGLLERLKPVDRSAIVLRYWYEMSYEEIAQTLSITIPSLKSRLHRARKELAQYWGVRGQMVLEPGGTADEASAL